MNRSILILSILLTAKLFAQTDSVLVTFEYIADSNRAVFITGSFNQWSAESDKMIYNSGRWLINLRLEPGYYYYKFIDNGKWIPDPENDWKMNDGGISFNSLIKVGDPAVPVRKISKRFLNKVQLPKPILAGNPEWIELYYKAWELAWNHIQFGNDQNGFVKQYLDEGFSNQIFQWDTNFMTAFAVYGSKLFPVMESIDNFYIKQRKDGYIQRVYKESDGEPAGVPSVDEPMVNPPLFAWMELNYFHISNDTSRLKMSLPHLVKYFQWIERNCKEDSGKGLYFNTPWGSGMDNTPREGVGKGAWVDFSSQQALAAKCIYEIATVLRENKTAQLFGAHYEEIKALVNEYCFNEFTGFYYDLREDGELSGTMHIGGFWPLVAEICEPEDFLTIREHLTNPDEFWRPHVVPTLSASDPAYDPDGYYWRGGVWAPTNYMVVKGLEKYGDYQLAHRIAYNHISNIYEVFKNFRPETDRIEFSERYEDGYHTIWECYSPELPRPSTRWDDSFYSRQDFVGWSGLGPIAMLIENVIGINMRADKNLIIWHMERDDKHGVTNLKYGDQIIGLICTPSDESLFFEVTAENEFRLEVLWNDNIFSKKINPGLNIFTID